MKDEVGRNSEPTDLRQRTKQFALRIVRLYSALPSSAIAQVMGRQLLRSGTSVGAHYREGIRSRSDAEFISKVEGALQELEETAYWLELLGESETISTKRLADLKSEADELTAILRDVRSQDKSKKKSQRPSDVI